MCLYAAPEILMGCLLQTFMNAHSVGEVALAGATSNLFAMLADCYRRSKRVQAGDEIIILDSSHEVCPPGPCGYQFAIKNLSMAVHQKDTGPWVPCIKQGRDGFKKQHWSAIWVVGTPMLLFKIISALLDTWYPVPYAVH